MRNKWAPSWEPDEVPEPTPPSHNVILAPDELLEWVFATGISIVWLGACVGLAVKLMTVIA